MDIQNNQNMQNFYKIYIDKQKIQQQKSEAAVKNVSNPQVRQYLEAANKVMYQLNQLDEFVYSNACAKEQPKGFFGKAKAFFSNIFKK